METKYEMNKLTDGTKPLPEQMLNYCELGFLEINLSEIWMHK